MVPGLFPCSRLAFQQCRSDVALEGPALDRLIAAMQECELVVLDEVSMCSGWRDALHCACLLMEGDVGGDNLTRSRARTVSLQPASVSATCLPVELAG